MHGASAITHSSLPEACHNQFQSRWLLWAHKNRWKEIRTISAWDISIEIDMMMRLTLILERDWLNKVWFWGQITCFNVYINVKGSDLYVIDIAYHAHYCDNCAHYIVLLNWSFVLSFCAYYPSPPLPFMSIQYTCNYFCFSCLMVYV